MQAAAKEFVASLGPEPWARARASFEDSDFREWTYLPGDRAGLSMQDLTAPQVEALWELVAASQGSVGASLVAGAMEVERHRREVASGQAVSDDKYWVRVYGSPDEEVWGWRMNGHHIGIHVVARGTDLSVTPHFIGAEPAEIGNGPQAGRRILGVEEDLARGLLWSLDSGQRQAAVLSEDPPRDILTRDDPVADPARVPAGLSHAQMTRHQRLLCGLLVRRYFDRAPVDHADLCWDEIGEGIQDVTFGWAGSAHRGARHYFCLRGPTFLVEYDNTQDDGNHAHSVWRDLKRDFGGDLLRRHYQKGHPRETTD
jgi:hypothetical protein